MNIYTAIHVWWAKIITYANRILFAAGPSISSRVEPWIDTGISRAGFCAPYRKAVSERDKIDNEIDKMIKDSVIN